MKCCKWERDTGGRMRVRCSRRAHRWPLYVCVCVREAMKYTLHSVWWTETTRVLLVRDADDAFLRAHICSWDDLKTSVSLTVVFVPDAKNRDKDTAADPQPRKITARLCASQRHANGHSENQQVVGGFNSKASTTLNNNWLSKNSKIEISSRKPPEVLSCSHSRPLTFKNKCVHCLTGFLLTC